MARRRIFRFNGVEVDPAQACVRRQGLEQHPRAKVFQVLLCLLEHRERVVTKEELIEQVWKGTAVTDDVVFHCVADIRTLLEDDPRNPRFVRTFPGTGYRFVAPVEEAWIENGAARRLPRWAVWGAGLALLAAPAAWFVISRGLPGASPSRGEVAWWRFDEGAGTRVKDSSGHGNDGVLVDKPVWTGGILGKALRFDGVRSYVVGTGSGRSLPRGGAPRTLSAWIQTSITAGDTMSIFHYGTQGPPYTRHVSLCLRDNGHASLCYLVDDIQGATRLDDGGWHFFAATYEGAQTNVARVFVDGVQQAAVKPRAPMETGSGTAWRIGRFMEGGTPFRGVIDDVRVYDRALSGPELVALYRCSSRQADLTLADGRQFYYLPVFALGAALAIDSERGLRHTALDLAGVQFARSDGLCSLDKPPRGADLGQDLYISAELLAPADPGGAVSMAGPYFRGRASAPGDGLMGPVNAGYWVQLCSTGSVKVRLLTPQQVVAFTTPPAGFDASRFHKLEMTAKGTQLQVTLDGKLQEFDQGGRAVTSVSIPPVWEGPPQVGFNHGTVGFAVASEPRGKATGQQVRNIVIRPLGR